MIFVAAVARGAIEGDGVEGARIADRFDLGACRSLLSGPRAVLPLWVVPSIFHVQVAVLFLAAVISTPSK